jgi:hypothetical protein
MIRRNLSRLAAALIVVVACKSPDTSKTTTSSKADSAGITLGRRVFVSKDRASVGHKEVIFCVDPSDGSKMFGASHSEPIGQVLNNQQRNEVPVFASKDGGKTWGHTLNPHWEQQQMDPACAYGVDGTAFFGLSPAKRQGPFDTDYQGFAVYRSRDGGMTWDPNPTYIDYPRLFDRAYMTVDRTNGPHHGSLYVSALGTTMTGQTMQREDEIVLFTSRDGGRTFGQPATVATGSGTGLANGIVHPGINAVFSDGTFIMAYALMSGWVADSAKPKNWLEMRVVRSTDGGRTLERPIVVDATGKMRHDEGQPLTAHAIPAVAIDQSKGMFHDRAYVVWTDARRGRREVWISHSDDKGKSWSPTTLVSDGLSFDLEKPWLGPENILPVVAVNKNGIVGVFFYQQASQSRGFWPLFVTSNDGGETWSDAVRVTKKPLWSSAPKMVWQARRVPVGGTGDVSLDFRPSYGLLDEPGDTPGLDVSPDGTFHIFPVLDTGGVEHLFTVPATVKGKLQRQRPASGAELRVDVLGSTYDSKAGTMAVNVSVTNISDQPLRAPISLVAGRSWGTSERWWKALNADNKRVSDGAVWRLDVPNGVLAPKQSAAPRRLLFRVVDTTEPKIPIPRLNISLSTLVARDK